jgi:hypothetical protein
MEIKVFESPIELQNFLIQKEEDLRTPSALSVWYWRAKLFYDPNVCGCKKKNLTEASIQEGYRNIVTHPEHEKIISRRIVGGNFTLKMNGEIIGTI